MGFRKRGALSVSRASPALARDGENTQKLAPRADGYCNPLHPPLQSPSEVLEASSARIARTRATTGFRLRTGTFRAFRGPRGARVVDGVGFPVAAEKPPKRAISHLREIGRSSSCRTRGPNTYGGPPPWGSASRSPAMTGATQ